MTEYRDMLKDIWVDASIVEDNEEAQPDWVYDTMHDIEKIIDPEELELHKERFIKRDNAHLYKGAKVRIKRDLYYGEMMHDPEGQSPDAEPILYKGDAGEIVQRWLDEDESDKGYYDCSIHMAHEKYGTWLVRVEWLEWEDDEDV